MIKLFLGLINEVKNITNKNHTGKVPSMAEKSYPRPIKLPVKASSP